MTFALPWLAWKLDPNTITPMTLAEVSFSSGWKEIFLSPVFKVMSWTFKLLWKVHKGVECRENRDFLLVACNATDLCDNNWRQAEAWTMLFARAVVVNALAQGALRWVTQWLWIGQTIFQLGGGHSTTELIAIKNKNKFKIISCKKAWFGKYLCLLKTSPQFSN